MAKVFVGGIAWKMTEDDLAKTFGAFGQVISAKVITDPTTGRSKGFAFVEYDNEASAKAAVANLHNSESMGRTLRVELANDLEKAGGPPRRSRS